MAMILVPLILTGIVGFVLIGWVLFDEWLHPANTVTRRWP
jgi:multidrug transporter EmrE-like cation transporter